MLSKDHYVHVIKVPELRTGRLHNDEKKQLSQSDNHSNKDFKIYLVYSTKKEATEKSKNILVTNLTLHKQSI